MKPRIIRPTEVVNALCSPLAKYARDVEAQLAAPLRQSMSEAFLAELLEVFDLPEAITVMKLVSEPRYRCTVCKQGRSHRRMSGPNCVDCAQKARRAAESQAQ